MHRVLAALDTSARSTLVLERAVTLARASAGEVVLLRVVGLPSELPPDAFRESPADVLEMLQAEALRDLERAAKTVDGPPSVRCLVQVGPPGRPSAPPPARRTSTSS